MGSITLIPQKASLAMRFFGFVVLGLWLTALPLLRADATALLTSKQFRLRSYRPTRFFIFVVFMLLIAMAHYYVVNIVPSPLEYFVSIRARIFEAEFSFPQYFILISPVAYLYLSTVAATELKSLGFLLLVAFLLLSFDFAKTDRSTLKPLSMLVITLLVTRGAGISRFITPFAILSAAIITIGIVRHEPGESEVGLVSSVLWHFYVDTAGNMASYFNAMNEPFDCNLTSVLPIASAFGFESCSRSEFYTDIGYFYNTYPAPAYIYSVWGWMGLIVIGFFIGLLNGLVYRFSFLSITGFSLYSLTLMGNIWLFRGFGFGATGIILAFALSFFAQRVIWKNDCRDQVDARRIDVRRVHGGSGT